MLLEICQDEALPVGYILQSGLHISCVNGHSYAMTTKTMAVGNVPDAEGPSDAFLAAPVALRDADDNFTGWAAGDPVQPLPAPYNCPECGQPLGIK